MLTGGQDVRNRLRTAQGHLSAIAEMIEREEPDAAILRQLLAVRGAMGAVERALWRAYLNDENCGLHSGRKEQRAKTWREVKAVLAEVGHYTTQA